ncbi:PREDICTED: LRR receptor-like serine/threonine-protein kinase FLS2 [Ipomoea nil]|uniref:LRR receptor-like serine/threonine-protein kinase FLS2 n=1 Tax=Ipomoea nil TaxID=35883 RepID=UPI00090138E0|nr:PREDICTED: LRR receptor-like serine/threonine-protein kinase FLS2 [Ipomoea nil]
MRMLCTTRFPLLYLFIFLCLSSTFTQRVAAKNMIRCVERERQALLDFKHGLVDDYGILSSWGSGECCNWWGVHCNNNTGHVTMLDLHAPLNIYGDPLEQLKVQKVSPSILELKHLNYLDLSYNDFQGNRIPEFIGSFKRLRVLSLMEAKFTGTIPPQLGNLTNLRILNITGSHLKIKNLEWLSLLSSLRSIDFSYVHFDSTGWPETSVSLSRFLEVLQFSNCGLSGALPFSLNSSSSSPFLSVVDLSENSLTSSSSVFHLLQNASKQLTIIDLSRNNFVGPIPDAFGHMIYLEHLDLFGNSFTNGIPQSFRNLTHLQILSLGYNQLNEPIAELFEKLSEGAAKKSLQTLDLSMNKLIGGLPTDINTRFPSLRELKAHENQLNGSFPLGSGLPSSLEYLDLSGNKIRGLFQDMKCFGEECDLMYLNLSNNQITGQFPDILHFSSLRAVDLSKNQLQGSLPETIGKLSKLQTLKVSSNSLKGIVIEAHFSNLTNLQVLDLSFNLGLSFNLSGNWIPPFQLHIISLANCRMGPQFPKWLQTQSDVLKLDISFGGISDIIPDWFWNFSMSYHTLNLSYNKIGGRFPSLPINFSFPRVIDLSSNNFSGTISIHPRRVSLLHLSNNKFVGSISFLCSITHVHTYSIDLSYNQFSGEIPDCWTNNSLSNLLILNLRNNHFFGKIPPSLGSQSSLQSLHLGNNNLTGELPSSLQNCTSLRVMCVGGNKFRGKIPSWIGKFLTNLVIVSLRHNKFYGIIPSSICHLKSIHILDLSGNKLIGQIPQCFNNFTYMMQTISSIGSTILDLNVSIFSTSDLYVDKIMIQWKNKEWEYGQILQFLKIIDLSKNQLIGDIPKEFSALKGLISLNLSNNHLTGKIFQTIYQMENLEVLDLSMNQLSGEIPKGLARLNFLAVLNLSNNFLSGKIPIGTQLQTFNASSYAGNIGLCGDPLPKCSTGIPPRSENNAYQGGDSFLDQGFYISMVLGFSLSFWGIVITLMLKDSWRLAYYGFLNQVKDWVYVKVKIYLAWLQQKIRRI